MKIRFQRFLFEEKKFGAKNKWLHYFDTKCHENNVQLFIEDNLESNVKVIQNPFVRFFLHQHWHDSPLWAWDFRKSFSQSALLPAIVFQFFTFRMAKSSSTKSFHLFLGLFLGLLLEGVALKAFNAVRSGLILTICPAHLILLSFYGLNNIIAITHLVCLEIMLFLWGS